MNIGEEEEIYINKTDINGAFHKDVVLIRMETKIADGDHKEGKVLTILERKVKQVVGEVILRDDKIVVVSDDKTEGEVIIEQTMNALNGHKVVVMITNYEPLTGDIIKIIGHKEDPGIDIVSLIEKYQVNVEFNEEIYKHLGSIPDVVDEDDIKNRTDLRNEMIITMDGEDAKDLDDAISLKKLDNGNYNLGVHIADVSYYVKENDPLDREAVVRGTSIYLVDRVIPMLPHKLSNGICSLNPKVDRFSISCFMEIDKDGKVVNYQIEPTIIHSKHRMTYKNVNKILDYDEAVTKEYEDCKDLFFLMNELREILRNKRQARGSIDFEINESKVIVDENSKVVDVILDERGISEHIIEEFMLVANETVATCIKWMDLPFIYRIHENPQYKKLQQVISMAKVFKHNFKGSIVNVYPKQIQDFLNTVKETEEYELLAKLLLRSMAKAKYSEESIGHFGLASEYYTHFTSPIRRYPDLLVHRLLRTYLFEKKIDSKTLEHYTLLVPELALSSSNAEINAVQLERDVEAMKKAEYMEQHIGKIFEGTISSVTRFGFFVELDNTIEGLVHVSNLLDDYYYFDEIKLRFVGERKRRIFSINDKIKVKVKSVDVKEGNVDFILVNEKKEKSFPKVNRNKMITNKPTPKPKKNKPYINTSFKRKNNFKANTSKTK